MEHMQISGNVKKYCKSADPSLVGVSEFCSTPSDLNATLLHVSTETLLLSRLPNSTASLRLPDYLILSILRFPDASMELELSYRAGQSGTRSV